MQKEKRCRTGGRSRWANFPLSLPDLTWQADSAEALELELERARSGVWSVGNREKNDMDGWMK